MAAARHLQEYSKGIQRLGSYGKVAEPKAAEPKKLVSVYLLALAPILFLPSWWLLPTQGTYGYAEMGGVSLANAKIVLFSESGENYEATTDKEGGFFVRIPPGRYKAMANGARQSVGTEVVSGKKLKIPFLPKAKKPVKARRSAS